MYQVFAGIYCIFTKHVVFFLETTRSTRPHSPTICGQGSVIRILQLPTSASCYTRLPQLDLIPRVEMVVSKNKKVITLLPDRKCVCTNCQRLFSTRVQPNLGFSLVQVNLPLNLFENRTVRTPRPSKTEV